MRTVIEYNGSIYLRGTIMTIQLENIDQEGEFKSCAHDFQTNCGNCRLNAICLPLALESEDIEQLDNIIQRAQKMDELTSTIQAALPQDLAENLLSAIDRHQILAPERFQYSWRPLFGPGPCSFTHRRVPSVVMIGPSMVENPAETVHCGFPADVR